MSATEYYPFPYLLTNKLISPSLTLHLYLIVRYHPKCPCPSEPNPISTSNKPISFTDNTH